MDPQQLFDQAAALQHSGRLAEAQSLYNQLLSAHPGHIPALESLAQICFVQGDARGAIDLLRRAVSIDPQSSPLHANLGIALAASRQFDEAVGFLERALQLNPASPDVPANLAQVHLDRANSLYQSGRASEAIGSFRRTLALRPGHPDALNNLSIALQQVGDLEEAATVCLEAIARHPHFAEAWYNLGRIRQDQNRDEEAGEAFARAISIRYDFAEAINNLAMTLEARGRYEEAIQQYTLAIHTKPEDNDAWINLGGAKNSGRVDEAIAHYRRLADVRPDLHEIQWNLGTTLLLSGDFEAGWPAAEARRKIPRLRVNRTFTQPEWKGEALNGKTILLHAEQGFGDAIQFVRYAPLVGGRGGRVVLLCRPELQRLFDGQRGIDQVVCENQAIPDFDVHCPLLSLPFVFGTTLTSIPAEVPYLAVDPTGMAKWSERLQGIRSRNVGIAWIGNRSPDPKRSISTPLLEPLSRVPGVRLISLQKPRPADSPPIDLLDFTDEISDFCDTAGLIANLDLVISIDTAVAHLAGAIAKPVWTLLPHTADWRWLLGRTDSPWYPTMRLFRQPAFNDWPAVIREVVHALSIPLTRVSS